MVNLLIWMASIVGVYVFGFGLTLSCLLLIWPSDKDDIDSALFGSAIWPATLPFLVGMGLGALGFRLVRGKDHARNRQNDLGTQPTTRKD